MELYLSCLALGVLFTLVSVILGDLISTALDGALDFLSLDFLNPTSAAVGITVFGGAGILMREYSGLAAAAVFIAALAAALAAGALTTRFIVKPLRATENSSGYTIRSLEGRMGEVITPLPSGGGCGEVLMRTGGGVSNHIATSLDGTEIQAGERVVVVEARDGTLYVTRFEK